MNTQMPVLEKPTTVEGVPEATPVKIPVINTPTEKVGPDAPEMKPEEKPEEKEELTWTEEIELAGGQLVEEVRKLIYEGNVRRIILRTPDESLLLEMPLMAGAVVGGVLAFFAPLLAVIGAVASVFARVKVEIVRVETPPDSTDGASTEAAPPTEDKEM